MKAAALQYVRPASTEEALALLAGTDGDVKPCGGTQSLGPMLNLRLAMVGTLVDLSRIGALGESRPDGDALVIGAAVTHARIEDGVLPDTTHGLLPAVAAGIAYRAVRNRGTIGGSLAHADPKADWLSTMLLAGAEVDVLGPAGARRVAAGDFWLGPFTPSLAADELLAAVRVPVFGAGARWAYRKTCRKPGEFAEAIVALLDDPARGVQRAVFGALDGLPLVLHGPGTLDALRRRGELAARFAAAGLDDPDALDLHAALLRRALDDLDRFTPAARAR